VNGVKTGVVDFRFARVVAGVSAVCVAGVPPCVAAPPGCKTGLSEHPDNITKTITRPVKRENTILLFNPASLPYSADESNGQSGKYIVTASPGGPEGNVEDLLSRPAESPGCPLPAVRVSDFISPPPLLRGLMKDGIV
jgi:hypothetical protein